MWSEVQGSIINAVAAGVAAGSTAGSLLTVLGTKFHDMSATNINNNSGAFVEVAPIAAFASTIKSINLSYTAGEPLQFRVAATAGAAAALSSDLFVANQGDNDQSLNVAIPSGSHLWVRSLSANAVATGYITMNLLG